MVFFLYSVSSDHMAKTCVFVAVKQPVAAQVFSVVRWRQSCTWLADLARPLCYARVADTSRPQPIQ